MSYHFYGPESMEPIEDLYDEDEYFDEMVDRLWDEKVDRELEAEWRKANP